MDGVTFSICPADSPSLSVSLRRNLESAPGRVVSLDGCLYLIWKGQVVRCRESEAGHAFLNQLLNGDGEESASRTEEDWKKLLSGENDPDAENRICSAHPALCSGAGVLVFRAVSAEHKADLRQIKDLLPPDENDVFVQLDGDRFAIVRKGSNQAEISDYAAAVIDTVNTETGIILKAGAGKPAGSLKGLSESCQDAVLALQTGEKFHLSDSVFVHNSLRIERIVDMIPDEEQNRLKAEYLTPEKIRCLSGEMLDTVQAYFMNDLNLSNTARKLFIHRNTLIYRLEKIRKEIGLDAGKFQDAVVLEMLICILRKDKT